MEINVNNERNIQSTAESVTYKLRDLYERYGYTQFKMNKFEEYDLYVRNKSFLLSDHIITFTDTDGKLMALKPDVTLSIVKSSKDSESGVRKVYYNENVYRVPRGAFSFKEIMQTGLECIGDVDSYSVTEVLTLAAKSLEAISDDFVLDVSDLGIISALIDSMGADKEERARLLEAVGEKSVHSIAAICREIGVSEEKKQALISIVSLKGGADEMLQILRNSECFPEAEGFAEIMTILSERFGQKVRIDFSVIDDMRYYNGIVFKGFVKGIPTSVLSGGKYDGLMSRMGKSGGAIGFAVYIDLIDSLEDDDPEYDTDVFVLYKAESSLKAIAETVESCVKDGKKVQSGKTVPVGLRYKELIKL